MMEREGGTWKCTFINFNNLYIYVCPFSNMEMLIRQHLVDLKMVNAKIIIADIYDEQARMVMCEAFKLDVSIIIIFFH